MPREVRRRIFYCLIAVFLVLGTGVVLYAQGWRAQFQPFELGKVGAIYIRTFPANATVLLNGKVKERKIGLFEKGALLNDILPGDYIVEAKANGFHDWILPVSVSSSLVINLQNAVLVPNAPTEATSTPTKEMLLAGPTLLLETASGTQTLAGMEITGKAVAGSEDGTIIISYATSTRNYFAADVSRSTSTVLGRIPGQAAGASTITFQPIPKNDTLFLAEGPSGLHLLRVPGGDLVHIATTTVAASAASPNRIAWAVFDPKDNTSLLSVYDISSQNLNSDFELIPGEVSSLLLLESGDIFAIVKDGSLYSLNFNQSSRVRLAQNARGIYLTRNSDKLAVLEGEGLRMFFLRGSDPTLFFPLPEAARAEKLSWYRDGDHLFVHYPDKVRFLDLDDIQLRNFTVVAETSRAEYEPNSNILYFLKENTLQKLEFPSS